MEADFALLSFIEKIERLGVEGTDRAAAEARPLIQAEIERTAGAGTDPYGNPWRLRKDGQRAMPNVIQAIFVNARGPVIVIRVSRGAAIQNYLSEKNRRQVIPDSYRGYSEGMRDALNEGANRAFRKIMGNR